MLHNELVGQVQEKKRNTYRAQARHNHQETTQKLWWTRISAHYTKALIVLKQRFKYCCYMYISRSCDKTIFPQYYAHAGTNTNHYFVFLNSL